MVDGWVLERHGSRFAPAISHIIPPSEHRRRYLERNLAGGDAINMRGNERLTSKLVAPEVQSSFNVL